MIQRKSYLQCAQSSGPDKSDRKRKKKCENAFFVCLLIFWKKRMAPFLSFLSFMNKHIVLHSSLYVINEKVVLIKLSVTIYSLICIKIIIIIIILCWQYCEIYSNLLVVRSGTEHKTRHTASNHHSITKMLKLNLCAHTFLE